MYKKLFISVLFCSVLATGFAQTALDGVLPLLQKPKRTEEETRRVVTLFRSAKEANVVFATGAALVKTVPSKTQEPALLSIVMRPQDPLKQAFAAIILTAMGNLDEELIPFLENGLQSPDQALRAYAAAAHTLIRPQDATYAMNVILLYSFDANFAARALEALAPTEKQQLKLLKQGLNHSDAATRAAAAAWLGQLHNKQAADLLLKHAKTETDLGASAQLAVALAKNREFTLNEAVKGLTKNYQTVPSSTYALALGLMTGHATDSLRTALTDSRVNVRINAARAAAYMANVLTGPDAFLYTSDSAFDIYLLKGLVAPLNALSQSGNEDEKRYADHALRQIEKLMETK